MITSSFKAPTTRLPFIAGALFSLALVASAPHSAVAQYTRTDGGSVSSRLDQVENQIQTLSRAVYRGEKLPAGMAPADNTAAISGFEDRIGQLEKRQRELVGDLERANYAVTQMRGDLDKFMADVDQRLQALEQRGASAPAPAAASPATTGAIAPAASGQSAGDMTKSPTTEGTLGTMPVAAGTASPEAATSLYESAFADIRESKFDSAEKKFADFVKTYPDHKLVPNAQYWLSETFYVRGDYATSARRFAQTYQDYPDSPKAADSLLKLGLSLGKLNKKEDACLSFQQLKKQFPTEKVLVNRADQQIKALGCGA